MTPTHQQAALEALERVDGAIYSEFHPTTTWKKLDNDCETIRAFIKQNIVMPPDEDGVVGENPSITPLSPAKISEGLSSIEKQTTELKEWILENAPYCSVDQKHLDAGTVEQAYWHYGRLIGLRDVLKALQSVTPQAREESPDNANLAAMALKMCDDHLYGTNSFKAQVDVAAAIDYFKTGSHCVYDEQHLKTLIQVAESNINKGLTRGIVSTHLSPSCTRQHLDDANASELMQQYMKRDGC